MEPLVRARRGEIQGYRDDHDEGPDLLELLAEVGVRPFADRFRDLLHLRSSLIGRPYLLHQEEGVEKSADGDGEDHEQRDPFHRGKIRSRRKEGEWLEDRTFPRRRCGALGADNPDENRKEGQEDQ